MLAEFVFPMFVFMLLPGSVALQLALGEGSYQWSWIGLLAVRVLNVVLYAVLAFLTLWIGESPQLQA